MSEHEFRWHPVEVREALASGERHPTASCSGGDWSIYAPLLDNEAGRAAAFAQHAQHLAAIVARGTKVASESVPVQAIRALAEEWTQRAYATLSIEHGLTITPVPGHLDRATVPAHWRDAAEDRATVPVRDLLELLSEFMTAPRLSETPDIEAVAVALCEHKSKTRIVGKGVRIPHCAESEPLPCASCVAAAQALAPVLAAGFVRPEDVAEARAKALEDAADAEKAARQDYYTDPLGMAGRTASEYAERRLRERASAVRAAALRPVDAPEGGCTYRFPDGTRCTLSAQAHGMPGMSHHSAPEGKRPTLGEAVVEHYRRENHQ